MKSNHPKQMNLSVRLTGPLSEYVTSRVGAQSDYDNASEYVRDLIRQDRAREEQRTFNHLKATLQEAFDQPEGSGTYLDAEEFFASKSAQRKA